MAPRRRGRGAGAAVGALATALVLAGCNFADTIVRDRGPASQAQFSVDPEAGFVPEDTQVLLQVREVECASGRSAEGRIRVDHITYGQEQIRVLLLVEPPPGDAQDCPSNPLTPFLLELSEPIGNREIVNDATDEIARRPAIELPDPAAGDVGGGVLIEADESLDSLGEAEYFLVEALWARGQDASELGDLGDLSLADEVTLVLGTSGISRNVPREELADPAAWVLDPSPAPYNGYEGPFSILGALDGRSHLVVSLGDHPHCASPARPAPPELSQYSRLGITPGGIDSCLQWFAVDVYVDPATGQVHGFVLDLWEP